MYLCWDFAGWWRHSVVQFPSMFTMTQFKFHSSRTWVCWTAKTFYLDSIDGGIVTNEDTFEYIRYDNLRGWHWKRELEAQFETIEQISNRLKYGHLLLRINQTITCSDCILAQRKSHHPNFQWWCIFFDFSPCIWKPNIAINLPFHKIKSVLAISLFLCVKHDNKRLVNPFKISAAFCNKSACHFYLPINMCRKLIHGIPLVFGYSQFNWCIHCFVIDSHSFVFTLMSVVVFSALWQRYSGSHTSFSSSMQYGACSTLIRLLGIVCCIDVRTNIFYSWQRRIKSFRATNKRANGRQSNGRQSNVRIHFFYGFLVLAYYNVCYFVRIINWMRFSAGWVVANDSWFIELTYCFSLANANFTHSDRPKGIHMNDRPFWRRPTNKQKNLK